MKKIYLIIATILVSTYAVNAQVVFSSSFENWASLLPTDWYGAKSNINSDSVIQVTGSSTYGNNAVRLKNTTTTHKRFTTQPMAVVNGNTYEIKFWVKGKGDIRTGLFDGRSTGAGYATYNPYVTVNSTSWTMYSQTITCANDTTAGEFILSVKSTIGTDHMMVDSVVISNYVPTPTNASIYDIQYTTALPANSPYMGQMVNTGGIVTAYYSNGYFVQAGSGPWRGIEVYDTVNNPAKGDSITITAMVQENFNNTRLTSISNYTVVSTANPLPLVSAITTTTGNTEDYEGCYTKCTGKCTDTNAGFGMWVLFATPDSLKIDDMMYSFTPTLNANYEVTGVISYSYSEFKLNPRSSFDVVLLTGIDEEDLSSSTALYPNPSNQFVNISGLTSNARISVFNVSGKLMLTETGNKVNTSSLIEGIYFVQINTGKTIQTLKLAVKH